MCVCESVCVCDCVCVCVCVCECTSFEYLVFSEVCKPSAKDEKVGVSKKREYYQSIFLTKILNENN